MPHHGDTAVGSASLPRDADFVGYSKDFPSELKPLSQRLTRIVSKHKDKLMKNKSRHISIELTYAGGVYITFGKIK